MNEFALIAETISEATGETFKINKSYALSGGDINSAFKFEGGNQHYFVKLNEPKLLAMFEAEVAGLEALAKTQTLRIPTPIVTGTTAKHAYIVLEFLELTAKSPSANRQLGKQLALLHRQKQAYFGWLMNNTIGSTPQINQSCADWVDFWRDHRLFYQLKLAENRGYGGRIQTLGEKLCSNLNCFFQHLSTPPGIATR